MNFMRQTACIVVYAIMGDNSVKSLFNYITMSRALGNFQFSFG